MYIDINNSETYKKATQVEIGGITYPKSIFGDTEKLNSLGIYKLTEDAIPNRRYYTYNEVVNVETRNIDRTPIAKDIDSLKEQMVKDVIGIAKSKLDEATSKYSPAEMASWENLEREAIAYTQGTEIELCTMLKNEADMCGQTYEELANEVIANANNLRDLRTYIVSTRYNKINEIKSLGSIEDIILYEATPYEYTYTEEDAANQIEEDSSIIAGDTVIRHKNNLMEW
jgi:hypothetical protein